MFSKKKKKFNKVHPQNYLYTRVKKRKKRIIFSILYAVVAVLFIIAIFYAIFFTKYFEIKNIEFYGNELVSEKDLMLSYNNVIKEDSSFLARKNIIIFPSSTLEDSIKKSFRRVKNLTVTKKFPDTLEISIDEFKPTGIACKTINMLDSECFYFDYEGIIFNNSPVIIGESLLFIYDEGISGENLPYKKYTEESIKFINAFKKLIVSEINITPKYFKFEDKYNDIELGTKSGFKIFLSQDNSYVEQAYSIVSVVQNEIKEDVVNLDYIDLRIKNRAYYKLIDVPDPNLGTEETVGIEVKEEEIKPE